MQRINTYGKDGNMNLHERYIFRSAVIADCKELAEKERGTEKIYLPCHKHLLSFYEDFDYVHLGTSPSTWGGGEWEDMVYTIERA
jgi:possible acetyltransferase